MNSKIVIIDYGLGNVLSVYNALVFLGYNTIISSSKKEINNSSALILPGVGAFGEAMKNIEKKNLKFLLEKNVKSGKPIMGICLGMQIMANGSEESKTHNGLGLIPGYVKKFSIKKNIRIPHVGWNSLKNIKRKSVLFSNTYIKNLNFYFDHSYHFTCNDKYVLSYSNYGKKIISIVNKDNIYGIQFHPEKSQNSGLRLFRSFFNYHKIYA